MGGEAGRNDVNTPPGGYFGQDVAEFSGLPSIRRGVGTTASALAGGRPEDSWGGIGETSLGLLGALGMAATPGTGGSVVRGARGAVADAVPRLTRPAREIGYASDGSVLPVAHARPFTNSFRGGNDDLLEAARMPRPASSANDRAAQVYEQFAEAARRRIPLNESGFAGVHRPTASAHDNWWRIIDSSAPERTTLQRSDLTATQDTAADDFARVAAGNPLQRVKVIEEDGVRYVVDGHHRALATDGPIDIDLYRTPPPPAPRSPNGSAPRPVPPNRQKRASQPKPRWMG